MDTRVVTEADLPAAAETLALAFEHDPVWGWGFEDADRERKLAGLRGVFGFAAEAALDYGWVRMAGEAEAVALWIPPGEKELPGAFAERFPEVVRESCGETAVPRIMELMDAFERNHPAAPPHFYLSVLGTHPESAGRRLGVGLVAACLEEIAAAGFPAYLESTNRANLARYERLGFRPEGEAELVNGLTATQMWHRPAS